MKINIQMLGGRGASSSSSGELNKLKDIIGSYGQRLIKSSDLRYESGKLVRRTKVGDRTEPDRAIRNVGDYKIYARHFNTALPYTHYYIANTTNGKVYEIPEVVTTWNSGALKEIAENLKRGKSSKPTENYKWWEGI